MSQNRFVEHAIRERTRFALTADVWESLGQYIESFPPACFVGNPRLRGVLYLAWKLHKKKPLVEIRPVGGSDPFVSPFVSMSLILIGLVGGKLCGCNTCSNYNFERDPSGTPES